MKFNYMDKTMPEEYKLKYLSMYKPDEVAILYTELKMLSFESAKLFKPILINDLNDFHNQFKSVANNPNIKVIIIDSLNRITELLVNFVYKKYSNNEAWKRWDEYRKMLPNLIKDTLHTNKVIIWLGLSEEKYNTKGDLVNTIQVDGKKLNGSKISSYFSIVLWTNIDNSATKDFYRYRLSHKRVANDARSLEGLFDKDFIPNDINYIFYHLCKYYNVNHIEDLSFKPQIFIAGDTGTGKTNTIRRICLPNDNET